MPKEAPNKKARDLLRQVLIEGKIPKGQGPALQAAVAALDQPTTLQLVVRFYQHALGRIMNEVVGVDAALSPPRTLAKNIQGLLEQMLIDDDALIAAPFSKTASKTTRSAPPKTKGPARASSMTPALSSAQLGALRNAAERPIEENERFERAGQRSKATLAKLEALGLLKFIKTKRHHKINAAGRALLEKLDAIQSETKDKKKPPKPRPERAKTKRGKTAPKRTPKGQTPLALPPEQTKEKKPKRKTSARKDRAAQPEPKDVAELLPKAPPIPPIPPLPPKPKVIIRRNGVLLKGPNGTVTQAAPAPAEAPIEAKALAMAATKDRALRQGLEAPITFDGAEKTLGKGAAPLMRTLVIEGLFSRDVIGACWLLTPEGKTRAGEFGKNSEA